jgi:hypothetical protein
MWVLACFEGYGEALTSVVSYRYGDAAGRIVRDVADEGRHLLRERPRVASWNHVVPALTKVRPQRPCFVPSVRDDQVPEQSKNEHKSTNNQR